jgi:uncharacterized protein YndB with AHSA1/START domain
MTVTVKSDLEIEFSRVFNAPRHLVFEAHSKPEHVRRWWGPRDSTMTECELDFRPGGRWRFVVRTGRGKEVAFHGEFREIVAPERFVWSFGFDGMPDPDLGRPLRFDPKPRRSPPVRDGEGRGRDLGSPGGTASEPAMSAPPEGPLVRACRARRASI